MRQPAAGTAVFEEKSVWKVLMKIAPPVMLAQLIQALYNIVDSFFVGKYSGDGLTALSIIFPVQLVITAIAVGTGVGGEYADVPPVRQGGEGGGNGRNWYSPGADQLGGLCPDQYSADAAICDDLCHGA